MAECKLSNHLEAVEGKEEGYWETEEGEEESQMEGCLGVVWEEHHHQTWPPWLLWQPHRCQLAWTVDVAGREGEEEEVRELEDKRINTTAT